VRPSLASPAPTVEHLPPTSFHQTSGKYVFKGTYRQHPFYQTSGKYVFKGTYRQHPFIKPAVSMFQKALTANIFQSNQR
jgi:hypothetical protein